jgi:hypothetical protein
MTILRIQHKRNYTCISNEAIRDKRLSFKARGIHHLLLSYPNNWEAKVEHLVQQSDKDGRSAVLSGLDELEEFGYLSKERLRDAKGQFIGWRVIVRETPESENPTADKSTYGSSDCGKSTPIINNDLPNKYPVQQVSTSPLTPQGEKEEGVKEECATVDKALITNHSSTPTPTHQLEPSERTTLLQELATLLQEPIENLRLNTNLQSALDRHPKNIPDALAYFKQAIATWKSRPGIGAFIAAVNKGHKPQVTQPGGGWGEWVRKAEKQRWFSYSQSCNGDIMVHFKNGVQRLWSELKDLTWETLEAIATT